MNIVSPASPKLDLDRESWHPKQASLPSGWFVSFPLIDALSGPQGSVSWTPGELKIVGGN